MDIAEVIQQSGLPASSLRFYEEKGLIASTSRLGLRRQYHESVIEHLAFISLARKAGFSLAEIADLLIDKNTGKKQLRRDMLQAKADELDKKIKELTAMREGLKHAAACPAPNHFTCPTFLRLLKVARKSGARVANKATNKTTNKATNKGTNNVANEMMNSVQKKQTKRLNKN
ncbi:helix-turn-helix domain-containing protein [Undibacterium sp. LX15W]|uniref:Helix-turn-helix domain-containing protein n=1 Tax=Undibacterium flavidum TaxID=2762297 RepID=A0ABR6Y7W2_9BURK|nr:helix-turn-helix domain-containing protein [Undibacterium flavidum]